MSIRLINYTAYPFHGYGGAELYLFNYAKTLVQEGHSVEIVCNSYDVNNVKNAEFAGINYTFIGKPFYGKFEKLENHEAYVRKIFNKSRLVSFFYRFTFWVGLLRYQIKNPSNFVHAFSDCGFIYTFLPKLKLISTIFDIENRGLRKISMWGIFIPIKSLYYSATTTRIVKKSSIVTSGGEDNTRELIDIFSCNPSQISVLPNAVDINKLTDSKKIHKQNRENDSKRSINFISIGRLEHLKNPLLVLDVFEEIMKKNDGNQYFLNIIGDGPLKKEVLEKITKVNKKYVNSVSLKSHVKEEKKIELLLSSDFYINLAETRYMLLVVMEAMACGLPVFSRYPLDGIITQNTNGLIYRSENAEKIADKIIQCIQKNDIISMGNESSKIIRNFTWGNTVRHGMNIYKNLKNI